MKDLKFQLRTEDFTTERAEDAEPRERARRAGEGVESMGNVSMEVTVC